MASGIKSERLKWKKGRLGPSETGAWSGLPSHRDKDRDLRGGSNHVKDILNFTLLLLNVKRCFQIVEE